MIEIFAQNHEVDFIENDTLDCGLAFSFLGYRRMANLIVQFQAQNTKFTFLVSQPNASVEVDFINNQILGQFSFLGYLRMANLIVLFSAQNTNFDLLIN